jgi:glycosyltransferase involved in cell wall biosynthesis
MREKLLLLTQFFPPETNAGANRIGPMAEALSSHYEVCVVTPKPSYPSPKDYRHLSLQRYDAGYPYEIERAFDFLPHAGSLPVRTFREQAMAFRLAARALRKPADIVIASSPSMFLGPAGMALARIKGAKFVWDVRDLTWGYAKDVVKDSRTMSFAAWGLKKYMLFVLRQADLVIGASSGITQVLIQDGADPGKAITAPNGISTEMLDDITQRVGEKKEDKRPVVSYAGLIGYNQNLGVLLDVARRLPEVDFVLAGDGPELPSLKERAAELGARNVSFRGYLDREGLLRVYAQSDLLFAHTSSSPTVDATMVPVKLFEYMASGKPIVYAGSGIATDLLKKLDCAATVPPEDPGAISTAIGQNGRVAVKEGFNRDRIMEEFARSLDEHLVGSGSYGEQQAIHRSSSV